MPSRSPPRGFLRVQLPTSHRLILAHAVNEALYQSRTAIVTSASRELPSIRTSLGHAYCVPLSPRTITTLAPSRSKSVSDSRLDLLPSSSYTHRQLRSSRHHTSHHALLPSVHPINTSFTFRIAIIPFKMSPSTTPTSTPVKPAAATTPKTIPAEEAAGTTAQVSTASAAAGTKRKASDSPPDASKVRDAIFAMKPQRVARHNDSPPAKRPKIKNGADARHYSRLAQEVEDAKDRKRMDEEDEKKKQERNKKCRERYARKQEEKRAATKTKIAEKTKEKGKAGEKGDEKTGETEDEKKDSTSQKHCKPSSPNHRSDPPSTRSSKSPPPARKVPAMKSASKTQATSKRKVPAPQPSSKPQGITKRKASTPKPSSSTQSIAEPFKKTINTAKTWFKSGKPGMSAELLARGFDWFTPAYCAKKNGTDLVNFLLKDDVTPQLKIEEKIREKSYLSVSCENLQAKLAERRKDPAAFRKELEDYTVRRPYGDEGWVKWMSSGQDCRKKLARLCAALDWLDAARALQIELEE
ncbi:hypothetical protein BU16DRAFT_247486 [Lophium mytilinum]|uniref:Uncharacterized protein n=1 Tax=Lophium mytilinum TaxID=390894 RepID=A0A6A6R7V6_9PEZI|nr:hypothetical protein BU16DRAFT_247486 [Lophium mytilinum]